jgi:LmbE family N-acetylglucosaminyl deacetylase
MSLVFIFAHPDDEAFGPGGTLAKFAQKEDVYLICVTNGNDKTKAYAQGITLSGLANIRKKELKNSAKTLGVKKTFFLDYEDGELRNNIYHEVAQKLVNILNKIKPDELMTFEPRGVSGHIDHMFVAMVTTFVFKKSKFAKKLYYYCLNNNEREPSDDYFIYFPPGYSPNEIDLTVDVSKYWDKKIKAIACHNSQIDGKVPKWLEKIPKREHFLILIKK